MGTIRSGLGQKFRPLLLSPTLSLRLRRPAPRVYVRPNATVRFHDYLYDSFGPYPAIMAAATAGINQWTDSPPDWQQGV